MDLLIMSLARAKQLKHVASDDTLYGRLITIAALILLVILIFHILPYFLKKLNIKKQTYKHIMNRSVITLGIIAIIIFFGSMPGVHVTHTDMSVADNIGCYYKMQHLRKVYKTIPSHSKSVMFQPSHSLVQDNKQIYHIKSTNYLNHRQQKVVKEYKLYLHSYRDSNGNGIGTGSTRLRPEKIHWWSYI